MQRYLQNNIDISLILDFQCVLHISTIIPFKSLQRWIITKWSWNFFETRYENVYVSSTKKTPVPAYRLLSSLSNRLILFINHYETPCTCFLLLAKWLLLLIIKLLMAGMYYWPNLLPFWPFWKSVSNLLSWREQIPVLSY